MSEKEFNSLRDDIKERGLQERIVLYQGKILDGRNRYQACKDLGIKPDTKPYTGDDPVGFVLGANRGGLGNLNRAISGVSA
jgi:ParB family chromosome partitioning protein